MESTNPMIQTDIHALDVIDEIRKIPAGTMLVWFFKPGPSFKHYTEEHIPVPDDLEFKFYGDRSIEKAIERHLKGRLRGMLWVAMVNPHQFPIIGQLPE